MTQQTNRTKRIAAPLVIIGCFLASISVANSSSGALTAQRLIELNDQLLEAKPVAGRNRRRIDSAINVQDYPRANTDNIRASRQSNKLRINVLSNDRGFKLRVVDINSRSAGGARVSLKNDMAVYRIPPHFSGEDSFWYTLEDKSGRQHSAKVVVCVCEK